MKINDSINTICKTIDDNIDELAGKNIQLLSQNIVAHLRNLVERVALKIYSDGKDIYPDNYDNIKKAVQNLKSKGQYKFLQQFYKFTQHSVSHYSPDGDSSYRLMLKYYVSLQKIKTFLQSEYQLEVLHNLDQFPFTQDPDTQQYYEKIAECIENNEQGNSFPYKDRCYILSVKPFVVHGKIYYQITFTTAHNKVSKFERMIAFTSIEIPSNYAVNFEMEVIDVKIHENIKIPVNIITNYRISIRPCEIDNFSKIFGIDTKNKVRNERNQLMQFLTSTGLNLLDIVGFEENYYEKTKDKILQNYKSRFFEVLDKCRDLIINQRPGSNVIRYLLFIMNNVVIKQQYNGENTCEKLSSPNLNW